MCSRCTELRGGEGRRLGFEGLKTVSLMVREAEGKTLDSIPVWSFWYSSERI